MPVGMQTLPWPRTSQEGPPVKIGIVSPYAYPRPGGANAHIRETYDRLRALGHEVRIITSTPGPEGPGVHRVTKDFRRPGATALRARSSSPTDLCATSEKYSAICEKSTLGRNFNGFFIVKSYEVYIRRFSLVNIYVWNVFIFQIF